MPKRSNDFQLLVKVIHDAIARVDNAAVTESAMLAEPSGALREVDILFERSIADVNVRIAIECRDRSRKSDVEWIDGLIGKFRDLRVDKIIAVSRRGFSETAKRKAEANSIDLRVLSECLAHDWSEEFIQLGMAAFEFKPSLGEVTITVDPELDEPISPDALVRSSDSTKSSTLAQLVRACFLDHVLPRVKTFVEQEFLAKLPPLAALTKTWEIAVPVDINGAWLSTSSGKRARIVKLSFQVVASSTAKPASVKHFKYGAAAMASVATLEIDDQVHDMKVVQLAGKQELSVSFKPQPRK